MLSCHVHVSRENFTCTHKMWVWVFTGRNEVVAKVMFLLVSVILLTGGVLSQHALQQVSGGVSAPRGCGLLIEGGLLVDFCYGLLVESDLLLWPSGKALWYGGISPNRDPFQPEGHTRMAFWYGLLV